MDLKGGGGEVRRKASSFRSKICLTIIKVSTVIPYLIKIQIRHISSETPLSSADQYFLPEITYFCYIGKQR